MVYTANFGTGKASLATVGYTMYNVDATTEQARTTTGVSEIGTATGIYSCDITFADGWEGIVLFDTGEASPRFVSIGYTYQGNLNTKLSDLPNLTTDAVWDEVMLDHNTAGTFGRRMNTWSLGLIRDSVGEIVKLIEKLNKLVKKRMKELVELLEKKTEGIEESNFKRENLRKAAEEKLDIKLAELKEGFSVLDGSISGFSEKLKMLTKVKDILKKYRERVSLMERSLLSKSNTLETLFKDISEKNKSEESKEFGDLKNLLDSLKVKENETFEKFAGIFGLIKSGIENLEKSTKLVAKMSSRSLDTNSLEEILNEEGILTND